jgi:hypothetical protein
METKSNADGLVRELIEKRESRELWGWKDPRTCLTIELYHPHLSDVRYVYVQRHPVFIVRSLSRRYGSDVRWGKLIKMYRERTDSFIKDHWPLELMAVRYENLMDVALSESLVTVLASFVGAPLSGVGSALERIHYAT